VTSGFFHAPFLERFNKECSRSYRLIYFRKMSPMMRVFGGLSSTNRMRLTASPADAQHEMLKLESVFIPCSIRGYRKN
jgi:hypothetical protein